MKLTLKQKKIINNSIHGEWHLLGKRETPPLLLWLKMLALNSDEMKKLYKREAPGMTIYKEGFTGFYFKSSEFKKSTECATPILFSLNKIKRHMEAVDNLINKAKEYASYFRKNNLRKVSGEKLLNIYNKTINYYGRSLINGFVTWFTPILSDRALSIAKRYKKKIEKLGVDEKTAFGILVAPCKESPYVKKEKLLDELAVEYRNENKEHRPLTNKKNIRKRAVNLHKNILIFLEKYGWVGYDYSGPLMSYQEVIDALVERNKRGIKKEKKTSREEIIKACKFKKPEKNIFDIFSILTYIKDLRNSGDDFIHYCLVEYLFKEVGRRHGLTKNDVQFLWPEELVDLLKGKKRFGREYIQEKKKFYVATTMAGPLFKRYYFGEEAKVFLEKIFKSEKSYEGEINELKGTIACPGFVTGKVKIINSFSDLNKMKKGNILVANMTSPRYMNAIALSSAIITNEGGLTCHAAIIAREFKKPCVIGTKIATKVLKDGDLVEVDANKGIIKMLDK